MPASPDSSATDAGSQRASAARQQPGSLCILVIEDERHTRQSLERFLRREGWTTLGFGTAAEAQAWLTSSPGPADNDPSRTIAGAVIDIHLPDGDGIDLTRFFRQRLGEGVPIVIVSGDTSIETLRRLRDAGGDRFVGKPMSLAALKEALIAGPASSASESGERPAAGASPA